MKGRRMTPRGQASNFQPSSSSFQANVPSNFLFGQMPSTTSSFSPFSSRSSSSLEDLQQRSRDFHQNSPSNNRSPGKTSAHQGEKQTFSNLLLSNGKFDFEMLTDDRRISDLVDTCPEFNMSVKELEMTLKQHRLSSTGSSSSVPRKEMLNVFLSCFPAYRVS